MSDSKSKGSALAIGVCFALFFMIAFVTNFAGAMGPILKNQFGASNMASQLGSAANFVAYFFMGIPGGLILKRKGYKFTSLLAAAVGFAGVGVQLASAYCDKGIAFNVYVTGAFVAGLSMCLLNLVVNPLLNTLGGGGNKGNQLVQCGCSLNSIGATLSPMILGWLVGGEVAKAHVGQAVPALAIAMAIFAVAFVVIAFSKIPEPHLETAEERANRTSVFGDIVKTLSFRHFSLGALAIFMYITIESGIPNMAMLYMTDIQEVRDAKTGEVVKKEISVQEAVALTTKAAAEKEKADAAIATAGKAAAEKAKAEGKDESAAKKAAEEEEAKKYILKPGDQFATVKWQKEGEKDFTTLKPEVKGQEDVVKADAKGKFIQVTSKVGDSYVGAAIAGSVVAIYWFCMMLGRLAGSALGAKISSRVMITVCSVLGISLMLATMYMPVKMVSVFGKEFPMSMCAMVLGGLCTSVMWGGIFNMAAEGLGKYVPMGSGIFMTMVVGGLMLPFQGMIADKIGFLNSYWLTIGLFAYVLFYALIGSRVTKRAE